MPLKKQRVSISFEKGLSEDRAAFLRQDGTLAVAENVLISHSGEVKKAPGDTLLDPTNPDGFGKMMNSPGSPLAAFDSDVHFLSEGSWAELSGGEKPAVLRDYTHAELPLPEVPTRIDMDRSFSNNELYISYTLSTGIYFTVVSTLDFTEIWPPTLVSTSTKNSVVLCLDGYNLVYFVDGSDIKRQRVSNAGKVGSPTTVYTTGLTDPAIHGLTNAADTLANIFVTSGGALNTEVVKDDFLNPPVTGTIYSGGGEIFGTGNIGDDLYTVQQFVPASGAGVFAAKWTGFLDAATVTPTTPSAASGDLASGAGTALNATIVKDPGTTEIWVATTGRNTHTPGSTRFYVDTYVTFNRLDASLSNLNTFDIPDIQLTGQGFQHGTARPFFPVCTLIQRIENYVSGGPGTVRTTGYQGYVVTPVFEDSWGAVASSRYLKDREAYSILAASEVNTTPTTIGSQVAYFLSSSVNISGNIVTGVPTAGNVQDEGVYFGGGLAVINTYSDNFYKNPVLGDYSFIHSGVNYTYDGRNVFENSLHVKPQWEAQEATPNTTQPQFTMFTTFRYTDARGNFHRSEPSEFYTDHPSTAGGLDVNVGYYISIPTPISNIAFEDDGREYYVELWLSYDNGDFYRVRSTQITAADIVVGGEINGTIVVDVSDDLWIDLTEGVWPGDLGEVIPETEPSFKTSGVFTKNVYAVPVEKENELWISKPYEQGQVEFSSPIVKKMAQDIEALVVMDDKAIMFHEESVSYLPLTEVTAAGTGISTAAAITTDTGINNAKSVALIDKGILYSTARGIYLLTRGLETKFIGWATQDTMETTDILGTQVYPAQSEVYFYLGGGSTKTVIYNYLVDQWYTHSTFTSRGTLLHKNKVYEIQQGATYEWDPSTFQKQQVNRTQIVETDWIKMSDVQDFKRLYHILVLGSLARSTLKVRLKYDYDETLEDLFQFNTDANADGVEDNIGGNTMQFRLRPTRQKVEAIKLRFEEVALVADSVRSGFSLKNLLLTVGLKDSEYKRLSKEKKR